MTKRIKSERIDERGENVVRLLGGSTKVGLIFGISTQNANSWRYHGVPDGHVRKVAELTGLDVNEVRRPIKD